MPKNLKWTSGKVRKYWNAIGGSSLDQLAFSRVAGKQFLDRVMPYLPEGASTVADFGAGAGHFSMFLSDAGYKVRIFEPSKKIVMQELLDRPDVEWIDPDKPGEPVDIVFCLEAIEHIIEDELEEFFKRLTGLVKPGGIIVISTPHDEIMEMAKVYCVESDLFFHPWQHVRSFTRQSLIDFVAPHGIVCDVIGTEDFSGTRSLYQELYALRTQVADFANVLSGLRQPSSEQSLNPETADFLESLWEKGKVDFLDVLQNAITPISNNMGELIRRIELDVRVDEGAAAHILDAAENVGRHAREFERKANVAKAGEEIHIDSIVSAVQLISDSAMQAITRITVAKAVLAEKSVSETLAGLNEQMDMLIRALEDFKAPLFPIAPGASKSANRNELPQKSLGDMPEAELRNVLSTVYAELSSRKMSTGGKSHTGFDFEFGAGSTLIFIGHKEG